MEKRKSKLTSWETLAHPQGPSLTGTGGEVLSLSHFCPLEGQNTDAFLEINSAVSPLDSADPEAGQEQPFPMVVAAPGLGNRTLELVKFQNEPL